MQERIFSEWRALAAIISVLVVLIFSVGISWQQLAHVKEGVGNMDNLEHALLGLASGLIAFREELRQAREFREQIQQADIKRLESKVDEIQKQEAGT